MTPSNYPFIWPQINIFFQFTVDGHNYDPMDEYTVSVIALHDSYQGNNSPDYIASHFTGVAEKTQRNTMFVAPDACCGAVRHNSKVKTDKNH